MKMKSDAVHTLSDDSVKGYGILPTDGVQKKAVESTAETDLEMRNKKNHL